MSDALIAALAQGGATAILLGLVLVSLAPRVLRSYERMAAAFRAELQAERGARREEIERVTLAIEAGTRSQARATRELIRQTHELRELRKDLSSDLPRVVSEDTEVVRVEVEEEEDG